MSSTYEVRVLNTAGEVAAVLDNTLLNALRYERRLDDVGAAQFTIRADLPNLPASSGALGKDTFFEVYRFPDMDTEQFEGTFMVRLLDLFEDEDGQRWLIVGGFSLEYLLLQRVIDPRNDPLMAGGYTINAGPADDIITKLVTEQAGSLANGYQQVPDLTVTASTSVGGYLGGRWAWENLLDTLQYLAAVGGVDFQIVRENGMALTFTYAPLGEDKTKAANYLTGAFVLFTPEFGNMGQPRLTRDWRKEKTAAYLLGRSDGSSGAARDVYEQTSGGLTGSPYSYAAVTGDARQVEDGDATEYLSQALALLNKHLATATLSFTVLQAASQYRALWDLGDRVTASWDDFEDDFRIAGITVSVTEDAEDIKPQLERV